MPIWNLWITDLVVVPLVKQACFSKGRKSLMYHAANSFAAIYGETDQSNNPSYWCWEWHQVIFHCYALMIAGEPVREVIDFVESDYHHVAYSVQFLCGFVSVAYVFQYVEGINLLEDFVSEWKAAYIREDEVWNSGLGFLDIAVHFAL